MSTILLVDDSREIRELLSATLKFDCHTILQAESGDDAVRMAREHRPDLVIMDIEMPGGIDGAEATRIIKSDDSTRSTTVIVVSGTPRKEKYRECLNAGASRCLVKPFSPLELIQTVEAALSGSADGSGT
ncbi:MAG: response regulator [Chitinivibrionales bacterium]|nr:response regulator [Chitinivibrionales bacterium]